MKFQARRSMVLVFTAFALTSRVAGAVQFNSLIDNTAVSKALDVSAAKEPKALKYPVWWFAPFWSGTGYSSEAINYMLSMLRSKTVRREDLWIAQHGDFDRKVVKRGMDKHDFRDLSFMEAQVNKSRPAIIVCHSLPTNWMLPSPMGWAGEKCPPDPKDQPYVYLIGRTMFETDKLPVAFVARCNAMNEVWVPSDFSKDVFIRSGVIASKVRVVPEGINTTYFNPDYYKPMPWPQGELVFGHPDIASVPQPSTASLRDYQRSAAKYNGLQHMHHMHANHPVRKMHNIVPHRPDGPQQGLHIQSSSSSSSLLRDPTALSRLTSSAEDDLILKTASKHTAGDSTGSAARLTSPDGDDVAGAQGAAGSSVEKGVLETGTTSAVIISEAVRTFRFLSTFKWEARKGWDVLLEAYLTEFTVEDDVELTIITKPFMGGNNFREQMLQWAEKQARARYNKKYGDALKQLEEIQKKAEKLNEEYLKKLQRADDEALFSHVKPVIAGTGPVLHDADISESLGDPGQRSTQHHHDVQMKSQKGKASSGGAGGFSDSSQQSQTAAGTAGGSTSSTSGSSQGGIMQGGGGDDQQLILPLPLPIPLRTDEFIPEFVFNASSLPRLHVVHHHIPDADLPRFYKSVDAFVLPSRGEGWGRPHVEAMSMGLPVISTNWSGITAFLDEEVGYPIKIDGLVPADGSVWWFKGLKWAQPSVSHLRQLMRRVYTNRDEAKAKGAAARQRMVDKFGPEAIGRILAAELRRVDEYIPQ